MSARPFAGAAQSSPTRTTQPPWDLTGGPGGLPHLDLGKPGEDAAPVLEDHQEGCDVLVKEGGVHARVLAGGGIGRGHIQALEGAEHHLVQLLGQHVGLGQAGVVQHAPEVAAVALLGGAAVALQAPACAGMSRCEKQTVGVFPMQRHPDGVAVQVHEKATARSGVGTVNLQPGAADQHDHEPYAWMRWRVSMSRVAVPANVAAMIQPSNIYAVMGDWWHTRPLNHVRACRPLPSCDDNASHI